MPSTARSLAIVAMKNGSSLAFAGLWERWTNKATGEVIDSFTIVTCEANELVRKLHERMPVILKLENYEMWLTGSPPEATGLMKPCPSEEMLSYFVSKKVNRANYDGPDLIEPIE